MHNPPDFLLAETGNGWFADAGMTILIGLVVVFAVLILLTFIFYLFGKATGRSKGDKPSPAPAEKTQSDATPAAPSRAVPAPVVEEGIREEVVAVIAAAVASMSGPTGSYVIRRIQRSRAERPVWAAAGIAENTRPF